MDGICQNCHQNEEGRLYQFYYGRSTRKDDREALYRPLDKEWENPIKVLGKAEVFLCWKCVRENAKKMGIRKMFFSIPMLIVGILGFFISGIDYDLKQGVIFVSIFLTFLGFILSLDGLLRLSRPFADFQKGLTINFAARVINIKKSTGANIFFNHEEYASLQPRRFAPTFMGLSVSKYQSDPTPLPNHPATSAESPHHTSTVASQSTATALCPKCGFENPPKAIRCQKCFLLLDDFRSPVQKTTAPSEPQYLSPQYKEPLTSTSLDNSVNAAANLATINAILTLIVAILQFIAGGEAMIAAAINTGAAIYYFFISYSLRKRDIGAIEAGITAAKWGFLWVLGMLALYVNSSGGIDCIAAFIFGGWLITDGLLYLILNNIKSSLHL